MAALILLSFRGHEGVKFYFGFLAGKLSKSIFLLFCSFLVYPLNYKVLPGPDSKPAAWEGLFSVAALGLSVVACLQIFKYCCRNTSDSHEEQPMMDDAPKTND